MSTTRTTRIRAAAEALLTDVAGVSDSYVKPAEFIAAGVPRALAADLSRASKRIVKAEISEVLDDLSDDLDAAFADDGVRDPRKLAESVPRS
jgi:hypothetical protein